MFQRIRTDIEAALRRDPAARSRLEVLLCYPGVHAVIMHRLTHWLWHHRLRLTARWLSQVARFLTGIEIHPAATIGRGLFIDHGMETVIGETTEIGDDCTLYQGVTLGGTGKETGKRHPTLGNEVVVGVGAAVLGSIEIGDRAIIGAGSVVLKPVPADTTVVGVPARVVRVNGQRVPAAASISGATQVDPCEACLKQIDGRFLELERRIEELQAAVEPASRPAGKRESVESGA
jgi:serine O-acetyltransferase